MSLMNSMKAYLHCFTGPASSREIPASSNDDGDEPPASLRPVDANGISPAHAASSNCVAFNLSMNQVIPRSIAYIAVLVSDSGS